MERGVVNFEINAGAEFLPDTHGVSRSRESMMKWINKLGRSDCANRRGIGTCR